LSKEAFVFSRLGQQSRGDTILPSSEASESLGLDLPFGLLALPGRWGRFFPGKGHLASPFLLPFQPVGLRELIGRGLDNRQPSAP